MFVVIFVLAALWLGGFLHYANTLPRQAPQSPEHTDGIAVLTGGADRMDVAFDLLTAGFSQRLLITGVSAETDRGTLRRALGLPETPDPSSPDMFACCVDLGHQALDTIGNASEIAGWVKQNGYGSLRVVTAAYHMPRSLLEISHALPETRLYAHPVFPPNVKLDDWWTWPGTTRVLASEYSKYLVALVRLRLLSAEGAREQSDR